MNGQPVKADNILAFQVHFNLFSFYL